MLDFVEGFVEAVVGVFVWGFREGVVQAVLGPFFYVPGFILLYVLTLGHYPPEFFGERGAWPSILVSVALWLAIGVYVGVLPV